MRRAQLGMRALFGAALACCGAMGLAQPSAPIVFDSKLAVRTVVSGLNTPTTMAFLGRDDLLVLEKGTGQVKRIKNGAVHSVVLDAAVNSASERGLLGIALHPNFKRNGWVYLYWTQSSTGADSAAAGEVPLLGNRVDRFFWDGATLTFDRNIVLLRSFQADAGQPVRGNHNGGVIAFAPRRRASDPAHLYIMIGDEGRRGQLQNILTGLGPNGADDQFGGPAPGPAHLTGVILRLNDDGSAPEDNPFFAAGAELGGEVGASVQKIFAYGVRNGFGMGFDPYSGYLWNQENGDDAFDEMNRIEPGANNGWVQIMGPVSRIAEYKAIETTFGGRSLQQIRWDPTLIADTPDEALARLFMLPGAHYADPVFSWKYAVAPAALGFMHGTSLGKQYDGDMFVGASRLTLDNGYLFRMPLTRDRKGFALSDPRLADGVADNADKFDPTESESLRFGMNFGIVTDIQTGPKGNLFVLSLSNGAIYEIYRRSSK